jgi:hypothetical protein
MAGEVAGSPGSAWRSSIGGKFSSSVWSVARTARSDLGGAASIVSRCPFFSDNGVLAGQFESARNSDRLMPPILEKFDAPLTHRFEAL